ncbi:hypothetical protein Fcan01_03088 [Folsomia candida]|uniref:DDB1- and CUL4-associated factor 12 beta-propeller domain-containing protein n=1 Tax=Folsomia candida TaxID=158441 RepID=A0A226EYE0_FOLCA|nr:hypothetical protein Fcan01_03088 [Folsomia candida]
MEGNRRNAGNGNGANRCGDFLMAGIRKRRIVGTKIAASSPAHRRSLLKRLKGSLGYADQRLYTSRQFQEGSNKYEEFFCYNENEEGDEMVGVDGEPKGANLFKDISINMTDFVMERQMGNVKNLISLQPRVMGETFQSQSDMPCGLMAMSHLLTNQILQEKPIKVENLNKVFCSQWLSDRQVIFGTKCNKLMVLDVQTKHMTQIPSLAPSPRSLPPDSQCGIHSIQINPSRTLLATGGKNPNDVAIYRLPTLDPVAVGEVAHQDWVFALSWLDDEFLVSGSRDTSLSLWRVPEESPSSYPEQKISSSSSIHRRNSATSSASTSFSTRNEVVPSYSYINAVATKEVISLCGFEYNSFDLFSVACVSLNGYIHIWSAEKFTQKFSRKLPFSMENVCLAVHEDYGLYAVGSKSHTSLMDARTIQCVKKILSKYSGFGIRSTNFYSSLLSIGTGQGTVMFYDLRAGKYLESNVNSARSATLKSSTGWTYPDEEIIMDVYRQKYTPAIYTHCVDMSGTRIFAAGGPLPITLCGNYIGLWH